MTDPRSDFEISRWAGNKQALGWYEELERRGQENVREHLRQRLASGSSGDISFGGVSISSEFVEDWLAWHENAQRRIQREHLENERVIAKWTRTLGQFTKWLVIVSALAGLISLLTAWILYTSDQTSRLRDRAFIYFGNPHITPYPNTTPTVWAFDINVTNTGNMPARRVTIRVACPDAAFDDEVPDTFRLVKQWQTAPTASVIGPKQEFALQGCEMPMQVISEAQNFRRRVFYLVEAQYLDGFDLKTFRVTQMSRGLSFDKAGGLSWNFSSSHNCSDDDCSK
jgi:hypothetical protein